MHRYSLNNIIKKFLIVGLSIISLFSIFIFFKTEKEKDNCNKTYTICKVFNVFDTYTDYRYVDIIYKIDGKWVELKNFSINPNLNIEGDNDRLDTGFYFIEYCSSNKDLFRIYSDFQPININSTFMDSTWYKYSDLEQYAVPGIKNKIETN